MADEDDKTRISATTLHLDELVARTLAGRIRIPKFQRGLKWKAPDVHALFDSIYKGYPIGTLIMWRRAAQAQRVEIGPVEIAAGAMDDAWWVVDGQQRLTSVVAALSHPAPNPADASDPFVVFFDLVDQTFCGGGRHLGDRHLVPIYHAKNAGDFQDWLFDFRDRTSRRDLIEPANAMATRIRNYRVPIYVVEGNDAEVAQDIFVRLNTAGKRMDVHEVFSSLAAPETRVEVKPDAIAARLGERLGPIQPNAVMRAALAIGQRDIARLPGESEGAPEREALMRRTTTALERTLDFMQRDVQLPHMRLLPHRVTPLVALAKFFDAYPEPSRRSCTRLTRWVWRGFFADAFGSDTKTLRRAVRAIVRPEPGDDPSTAEEATITALMAQVPASAATPFTLPERFDSRHAGTRLAMLITALSAPVDPTTGASLDVFSAFHERDAATFCRFSLDVSTVESRFLMPGLSPSDVRLALSNWAREDLDHPALKSHLIDADGAAALLKGQVTSFLSIRRHTILRFAHVIYNRKAEPRHSDRPSLQSVLS